MIWNNNIESQDSLSDCIDAYSTKGITGSGYDAIGLRGSTLSSVKQRRVVTRTREIAAGQSGIQRAGISPELVNSSGMFTRWMNVPVGDHTE
jgi:hypothetical protein